MEGAGSEEPGECLEDHGGYNEQHGGLPGQFHAKAPLHPYGITSTPRQSLLLPES